ncbi:MAG: glycoside hydrolase family 2 TIM barrel-domain containing protein [Bacteroidales bacterium]
MKTLHWIVLSAVIILATWFIYRTREPLTRTDTDIDLNWRFTMGDPAGAQAPGFDDSGWRYVSLPHDWMIGQPVDPSNATGTRGGFYPSGVGWYRRTLDLSENRMEQFYLLFEGAYMNADVYFNGTHLGRQRYGYASFYHDITGLIRRDTLNVIAVRTDCSDVPADRWYSGAGLYRKVRLIATRKLHFPIWGHHVSSEMDSNGDADLNIAMEVWNRGRKAQRFEVLFDVLDPEGHLVAEGSTIDFLQPGSRKTVSRTIRIEDPRRWSPDRPVLYTVNCYLKERNTLFDHVVTRHGFRSIGWDPDRGFLLNGEKVILKGVCLHHDGGELGAAVPIESWRRRFTLLKELGVNAIRFAHNPHSPEVLDLCDRMGFLVIEEMYDKWETGWDGETNDWFTDTWKTDLANFIRRDRNHPSVILWSVGNEVAEQLEDPVKAVEWYGNMIELVRSVDPSRMVTCALHPGNPERGNEVPSRMMHLAPVVSYNYRTDSFSAWHEKYPGLVFIATETRPYGTSRKKNYQEISFADNSWNDMEEYVAGQFIWAGIDYLGESMGWPDRGFRHGLLETSGFIKPYAWYIGSRYREDPMVKLTVKDSLAADSLNRLESWQSAWAGAPLTDHWSFQPDGTLKEIVIFTNCERVDLQLNGRLVDTLRPASFEDGVIKKRIRYEPGHLVAHALYKDKGGRTVRVSDTLRTSASAYALAMDPDRDRIAPGNPKLVHIATKVLDSLGILDPHSRHMVNYNVDGPGRIRAIDNGDLADHTHQGAASREVRRGRQLMILQAGNEPGDVIVKASAEGLKPATVKIRTRE